MEKNINFIGEELFNKIRSKFPSVTLGNQEGMVTNNPTEARFFDFEFKDNNNVLGNVSISLDETSLNIMYAQNFVENQTTTTKKNWYAFLRELRNFSKKRLLTFDVRDITKSNLDRRDYQFLAKNAGEGAMTESRLYGTSKTSYQDIGAARLSIKHSQPVNNNLASGRTQYIENIYVENAEGERFKYPIKHLNGARAMARHISEGGTMHDDFGKHIVSLSEELGKLKKFKNYVSRSNVMAEGLSEYADIVSERIVTVKKTIESIQKENRYREMVENFSNEDLQEVPQDVAENWIDQLTIKQFNEELQEVFPYIYKLISEKQAKKITPDNIIDEVSNESANETDDKHEDIFTEFEDWAEETVENALDSEIHDGNAYVHAVRQAKMNGKKKGDSIPHPDSNEPDIKIEKKLPITEFILSMFDRETGQFPKGETAVLTAIEKDYGENLINPAKQFIEAINQKFREYSGYDTDADGILSETPMRFKAVQSANGEWKVFDTKTKQVVHKAYNQHEAEGTAETLNRQETENVEEDLIDPKPKSDRRYFVVPDMEDYYDIQNDRRFAGSIEVADENSEVMVLPNSRFHKLKMMYGDKVQEVDPQFTRTYENDVEESGLQYYLGKKKYGKDGMKALAQAGRDGASQEELGKIKDKYIDDSMDILRLAGVK